VATVLGTSHARVIWFFTFGENAPVLTVAVFVVHIFTRLAVGISSTVATWIPHISIINVFASHLSWKSSPYTPVLPAGLLAIKAHVAISVQLMTDKAASTRRAHPTVIVLLAANRHTDLF